jgi:serine/threonine protein kinase
MKFQATSFGMPAPHHSVSEDAFAISPCEDGGLLCVLSDGVGSARDPRRCAERVVRLVSDNFAARPAHWSIRKTLERLIEEANLSLCREGAYLDGAASMQATLAAVCLTGNRLFGINIGDSPILFLRNGIVERLSETHTVRNGDGRNILTNAVGMAVAATSHYFEKEIREGDIVVVTSDGLTQLLDDMEIGHLARKSGSARSLVGEALELASSKAFDDLSAIVIEVKEIDPAPPEAWSLAANPLPKLAKGVDVDGFQLLRPMAGNPRVWLAGREERRFVLKFLPAEAETDDSCVIASRFHREARNAVRLQGEFFVPARLPESGSPWYYVMDYLEAPSLRFFLRSRCLTADEALELGRFLCNAEQFLLRQELVHGDIKPENLLIFREAGEVSFRLLDLGLATPVFTDSGVSGTPSYLAPERFGGAVVTERTEIFSIGATLYEALTGHAPFGHIERFQTPHFGRIQKPSKANPNVPPWLDGVILKSLSVQKDRRYQCYSELRFALDHPEQAPLDFGNDGPLLERNPLLFYKAAFWLLLLLNLFLLFKLFS